MCYKIGFFCLEFPNVYPFVVSTTDLVGGSGKSLLNTINALEDTKYHITIFSTGNKEHIQIESPSEHLLLYRYPVKDLFLNSKLRITSLRLSISFLIRPLKHKFDLVHCQLGHALNAFSALIYSINRNMTLVLSIRGVPKVKFGTPFRQVLMRVYMSTLFPLIIKKCDIVVVQSKGVLKELPLLEKYTGKIRIVPNGVNFGFFSKYNKVTWEKPSFKALNSFNNKLLFVGSLVERKGLGTLLEAFEDLLASHPSSGLILVGEGPLFGYIKNRASANGYADRILMTGYIRDTDKLAQIYAQADLLILPSLGEGFPRVVLESMAAGTPCLVSDIPTNVSAIGKGKYGLTAKTLNPADFAEKIRSYIEMDENKKQELSKKCIKYAKNHSWKKVAKTMEKIYDSLLRK